MFRAVITAAGLLALQSPTSAGESCRQIDDLAGPAKVNFRGVPIERVDGMHVLKTPVGLSHLCVADLQKAPGGMATLMCVTRYSNPASAQSLTQALVDSYKACRPDHRANPIQVAGRVMSQQFSDVTHGEAWEFRLEQKADAWEATVTVVATPTAP